VTFLFCIEDYSEENSQSNNPIAHFPAICVILLHEFENEPINGKEDQEEILPFIELHTT